MSVFLTIEPERVLHRSDHFFLVRDAFPVSPGHTLIVSNRLIATYFDLTEEERGDLGKMIFKAKEIIEASHAPTGFNIGMNCGISAGQTVMHFHCHVIPRYDEDVENPRGGVRHCVIGKGYY